MLVDDGDSLHAVIFLFCARGQTCKNVNKHPTRTIPDSSGVPPVNPLKLPILVRFESFPDPNAVVPPDGIGTSTSIPPSAAIPGIPVPSPTLPLALPLPLPDLEPG